MKKNIVIIILAILVLCLGGYLVYDKVLSNDNNDVIENEEVKEEIYDLVVAKTLVSKYIENSYSFPPNNNIFKIGLTEDMKMFIAYNNARHMGIQSVDCLTTYVSDTVVNDKNEIIGFCDGTSVGQSYYFINESYKQLFGNSTDMLKKDIKIAMRTFDYRDGDDMFVELTSRSGSIDASKHLYSVKYVESKNNKLVVGVGYYILKPTDDSLQNYYCELNQKNYSDNQISSSVSFEEDLMSEIINKVDVYKFTFFKENGVYKLESMVKE